MTITIALLQAQDAVAAGPGPGIGTGALIFMLVCMGSVLLLTAWCFTRILQGRQHFDPDGTGPARPPVPGEVEQRRPGR